MKKNTTNYDFTKKDVRDKWTVNSDSGDIFFFLSKWQFLGNDDGKFQRGSVKGWGYWEEERGKVQDE
jgi:hypothetical protein